MFGKTMGRVAIAAAAMSAMAPAHAASFVFTGNTALYGGAGNGLPAPVTSSGITVTATAWYTATNAAGSLPVAAYLGDYGSGLGVTNAGEGQGNQNSSHTVSNTNGYDFIRLEFSTAVRLTGLTLTGFNVGGPAPNPDTDAWVSYGSTTDTFGAGGTGTGVNNTAWAGFLARGAAVGSGSAATYVGPTFSKVWLIAADRSGDNRNDGFKIGVVNAVAVPEPATWAMLIVGFGAVGGALRRRKVAARVTFA